MCCSTPPPPGRGLALLLFPFFWGAPGRGKRRAEAASRSPRRFEGSPPRLRSPCGSGFSRDLLDLASRLKPLPQCNCQRSAGRGRRRAEAASRSPQRSEGSPPRLRSPCGSGFSRDLLDLASRLKPLPQCNCQRSAGQGRRRAEAASRSPQRSEGSPPRLRYPCGSGFSRDLLDLASRLKPLLQCNCQRCAGQGRRRAEAASRSPQRSEGSPPRLRSPFGSGFSRDLLDLAWLKPLPQCNCQRSAGEGGGEEQKRHHDLHSDLKDRHLVCDLPVGAASAATCWTSRG